MGIIELVFLGPLVLAGSGDLLSLVDTQTYWQIKGQSLEVASLQAYLADTVGPEVDVEALVLQLGDKDYQVRENASKRLLTVGRQAEPALRKALESTDPEIRLRAGELLKKIAEGQDDLKVTRLMAIRTLGELKDPAALPLLEKLTSSKNLFEADYARRAIALIKTGQAPATPPTDPALLKKHLWMLPRECGYVAQLDASRLSPTLSTQQIFEAFQAVPEIDTEKLEEIKHEMTKSLSRAAAKTGNFRFKAATIGVAQDTGEDSGFVVLLLHGLYDKAALEKVILAENSRCQVKPTGLADVKMYQVANSAALFPVTNQLLIFTAGPNEKALPTASICTALQTGKGTLDQNTEMKNLIGQADTTKPFWLAAHITDKFWESMPMKRDMIPLGTFEQVTASMDFQDGSARMNVVAHGRDATNVEASVTMLKAWAQMGATMLREQPLSQLPMAAGIIEFLESIQYLPKGKTLTISAHYKGNIIRDLILLPAVAFVASAPPVPVPAPAAAPLPPAQHVHPIQPVPAPR